jgi:hypothetical protein
MFITFMGGGAQESQLFAVSATPIAQQMVHLKAKSLEK